MKIIELYIRSLHFLPYIHIKGANNIGKYFIVAPKAIRKEAIVLFPLSKKYIGNKISNRNTLSSDPQKETRFRKKGFIQNSSAIKKARLFFF